MTNDSFEFDGDFGDPEIAAFVEQDLASAAPDLPIDAVQAADAGPAAEPYDDTPYPDSKTAAHAHPFDPRARFKQPPPEWLDQATKAARGLPFIFDGVTEDRAAFDEVEAHKGPQLRAALAKLIAVSVEYNADVLLDAYAALIAVTLVDIWFNASHSTALNALAVSQFQLHSLFHQMIMGAEAAVQAAQMQDRIKEIFDRMAAQAAEGHAAPRFPGVAGLPN